MCVCIRERERWLVGKIIPNFKEVHSRINRKYILTKRKTRAKKNNKKIIITTNNRLQSVDNIFVSPSTLMTPGPSLTWAMLDAFLLAAVAAELELLERTPDSTSEV